MNRAYWGFAAAVLVLYLLFTAGTALTKRPWSDEGWFASPAYNLAYHGYMGTSILESVEPRGQQKGIDKYTYWVMPLDIVAQAAWYRILGFGLFQMRMLSAFWGLVAILTEPSRLACANSAADVEAEVSRTKGMVRKVGCALIQASRSTPESPSTL